jgi:hypothetical protein
LLAELGAKFRINPQASGVESTEDVMPRVTVAQRVTAVPPNSSAAQLASLDPRDNALWSGPAVAAQDPAGAATITERGEGRYRIHYRVRTPSLIRVAEAYYPGWQASVGGRALEVHPADHALIGFVAPAGEGDVELRFRLRNFNLAAAISLSGAILAAVILLLPFVRRGRSSLSSGMKMMKGTV